MLIRYNGLVANYHTGITKNTKVVIRTPGMPGFPKNTSDEDVLGFLAGGFDVIIPEYYGSFRSAGEFTIDNCFKTVKETISICDNGSVFNVDTKESILLKYNEIYLFGSSWGAYFIIRNYDSFSKIKAIGLAYPMLTKYGNDIGFPEEKIEDTEFDLSMKGLGYFYRFPEGVKFTDLYNSLDISYIESLSFLSNMPLFIGHGTGDKCIHHSRSQLFFDDLQISTLTKNKFVTIPGKDHGSPSRNSIIVEFVKWTYTL